MDCKLDPYERCILEKLLKSDRYVEAVLSLVSKGEIPKEMASNLESTRRGILMTIAPDRYDEWSDCCESWRCSCDQDLEIRGDSACPSCESWRCSCDGKFTHHEGDETECESCGRDKPPQMELSDD